MERLDVRAGEVYDGLSWPAMDCFPSLLKRIHRSLARAVGCSLYMDKDIMLLHQVEFKPVPGSFPGSFYERVDFIEVSMIRFNERSTRGHDRAPDKYRIHFKVDGLYYERSWTRRSG